MKYSIIIPTFNEEKRIVKTIQTVNDFFTQKRASFEIIISDDKSTDKTIEVLEKNQNKNLIILKSERNYYKGWPVKMGMLKASGDYVLMTDADLSTPIEEVDKLQKAIDVGFDIAIGSRIDESGKDERESQPFYRRILGKIFTYIRSLLTPEIKDSQCGFKMFTKKSAADLFKRQRVKNIIFDVEVLFLARKLRYKIAQVPVKWAYSGETRMRLTLGNAISTVVSLVNIYLWHRNES